MIGRIPIIRHAAPMIILMSAALGCDAGPGQENAGVVAPSQASETRFVPDSSVSTPLSPGTSGERTKTKAPPENEPKATANRKIVYNANINLVTEDLNAFESNLTKIVVKEKAYIADSDRSGTAGSTRFGSWKVRVPAETYDEFVELVLKLGELVTIKANSQDVTEEYYDLDARQTNKKVEEARLLKHLTDSTGKLDEILAVERELSRVRGEIERMQGRLRVLADLTTLATVTVNANEIKGYIPPQAPTLATKVGRTFAASIEALRLAGEGLVLLLVALAPWLPFIAIFAGLIIWLARRPVRTAHLRASASTRTSGISDALDWTVEGSPRPNG